MLLWGKLEDDDSDDNDGDDDGYDNNEEEGGGGMCNADYHLITHVQSQVNL